jgi:DNA-binding MarR family transcriptional regulator
MWWMIGLSTLGTLAVLFLFGRRNEHAVRRDWVLLLTPKGRRFYERVEGRVHSELALAEVAYDEAFEVRALGSMDEAARLLDVGFRVIERFAPDMLRLLSAMAAFSRMVAAMAPVPPLRPKDFHLTQLASLAHLNRLLHQFLVSTGERFRLRLYVLGRGFGLATRFLLESTRRIVRREGPAEREWAQIEAIRDDLETLTEESLASLRVLLVSLGAERRDDLLRGP